MAFLYIDLYILSTKNEDAIYEILNKHDFSIDYNKIIGKNKLKEIGSKKDYLNSYISNNKTFDTIYLVDDNLAIVESCKNLYNLKTYIANWGYVKSSEIGKNSAEIIDLIKR